MATDWVVTCFMLVFFASSALISSENTDNLTTNVSPTTAIFPENAINSTTGKQVFKLGLLIPTNSEQNENFGWKTSASAVTLAIQRAKREGLLDNIDIKYS